MNGNTTGGGVITHRKHWPCGLCSDHDRPWDPGPVMTNRRCGGRGTHRELGGATGQSDYVGKSAGVSVTSTNLPIGAIMNGLFGSVLSNTHYRLLNWQPNAYDSRGAH